MRINKWITFIVLLCMMASSGCVWLSGNREPVYNVIKAPIPIGKINSIEEVGKRIRLATRIQNWKIEEYKTNIFLAKKNHGSHVATAAISYNANTFSIKLRGSDNFKEGDGYIHLLYNKWVHDLEGAIIRELSMKE